MKQIGIILVLYFLILAYSAVCYIFMALGVYTIGKRRGIKAPWLAFIPYTVSWPFGAIADDYMMKIRGKQTKYRKNLLIATVLLAAASELIVLQIVFIALIQGYRNGLVNSDYENDIPLVICIFIAVAAGVLVLAFMIWYTVVYVMAIHKIYLSCVPSRATLYTVLSAISAILSVVFIFTVRNKDEGMIADRSTTEYLQQ